MPRAFALFAALAAGLSLAGTGARADGRLSAKYALSVGGVELGRGAMVLEAGDTAYEIAGNARVTGVLRAVSAGKGTAASRGALAAGKLQPRVFAMNADAGGKKEMVRLVIINGAVKEQEAEPPLKFYPDRVEISEASLANVMDPMSGAFPFVPGTGDVMGPAACDRTIPVFDGRQRYNIVLKYQRKEEVKAEGYEGPAVLCQVRYVPIAGHRPTRSTVKYMMENEDIFVWLVPVAGTRLMAPFRVSVATMIGTALLEATEFKTEAKEKTQSISAPRP